MQIIICKDRTVEQYEDESTSGENNAETMYFTFPETIAGIDTTKLTKWIQFKIDGLDIQQIIDNEYSLTDLITQHDSVEYQVLLKYEEVVLWKSEIAQINFNESLDTTVTITLDDLSVANTLISELEALKEEYEEKVKELEKLQETVSNTLSSISFDINENGYLEVKYSE